MKIFIFLQLKIDEISGPQVNLLWATFRPQVALPIVKLEFLKIEYKVVIILKYVFALSVNFMVLLFTTIL